MSEGFFGRHRGHRNDYNEEEVYASEIGGDFGGGRPRPEAVYEGGGEYVSEVGDGYGRPPPAVAYEGGGYGRPPVEYEGGGYGSGSYAQEGYGRPPVMYEAPLSDLGTGLRNEPLYAAGYGAGEYEEPRHHGRHHRNEEEEYEEERKHSRRAEEAAAAAVGYGLYERHEKREDEERLEDLGYDEEGRRKHGHHLFRRDD